MHRLAWTAIGLLAAALLFTACSHDTVTLNAPEDGVKRVPPIFDPPEGFDPFFAALEVKFDNVIWIEVKFEALPAKNGGTVSIVPDGYPETHPIRITLAGDPLAGNDFEEGTLWVAAEPTSGSLYVPGNCIIYRTLNIPPNNKGTAIIELPIVSWYNTDNYNGTFTSYDLVLNDFDFPDADNLETIQIAWPPADPDDPIYVNVQAGPGKDSDATDRVVDPELPGEDDI